MKISYNIILILFIFPMLSFADEGMWIPSLIESQIFPKLKDAGCKLTEDDIYSINKACIKDAIVHFDNKCTGVIVSENGILFTNYHCADNIIQSLSSLENDYLKNGYWSKKLADEIPISGLTVSILENITDVSQEILNGITPEMTIEQKQKRIQENKEKYLKANFSPDDNRYREIESFYYDNQFFLFTAKVFKDIRLVAAPPASIGSFGKETDNWMWPRHNADFSVFRIYVDSLNNPSDYSQFNVPYKSIYSSKISVKEMAENDFTMILGYPGRTQEYLPSIALQNQIEKINVETSKLRKIKLDILSNYMKQNDEIRINYYSNYAEIANVYKKSIGENFGIIKSNAVNKKLKFEAHFNDFINQNDSLLKKYGYLIPTVLSNNSNYYKHALEFYSLYDGLYNTELAYACRMYNRFEKNYGKENYQNFYSSTSSNLMKFYKHLYIPIDKEITTATLKEYLNTYPNSPISDFVYSTKNKNQNLDTYIENIYSSSILFNKEKSAEFLNNISQNSDLKEIEKLIMNLNSDIGYQFGHRINTTLREFYSTSYLDAKFKADSVQSIYMQAIMSINKDSLFYPDANGTLRLSYGNIKKYSPQDAILFDWYTTSEGLIAKAKTYEENSDYEIPKDFIDLLSNSDTNIYFPNGGMHLCFIATNHTSGGNSGSPVFNSTGELIGLNFDRNWHGTMSDLNYDINYCRNIAVDSRYILFILKYYGKVDYVINEFNISN